MRAALLTRFARIYGIDLSEAEKPLSEYTDFDAFFTRRLRADARPIDQTPGCVVSPADGTVTESGIVTRGTLLQAKGMSFSLSELLADEEIAARLEGGAYVITYLSPKDYHRVHSPASGAIVGWNHVPGSLFMVGAKTIAREPGLFVRNERFVTFMESESGPFAVVMVAAVGVGHVTASYDPEVETHGTEFVRAAVRRRRYDKPRPVARGEELGIFHLGSTTIAVFPPGRVVLEPAVPGTPMKMGAGIGRFV